MRYGYMGKINSAQEFNKHLQLFEQRGVLLDNIVVNLGFDEFIASFQDRDVVVVVCSYVGLFASLGSYLTTATELMGKGIVIESLLEPNMVIDNSNSELIRELNNLNRQLRSASSIKSINKLKDAGKKLGRPRGNSSEQQKKVAQVEKLRKESNISTVDACKLVGCNVRTYYRLKDNKRPSCQLQTKN